MSLGDDDDIAVVPGTSARAIVEAARDVGRRLDEPLWCGDVSLDPEHPAGVWPLLDGALLDSTPSRPCAPPRGPSLLVVAGPDAGASVEIPATGIVVGRGETAGLSIADPAISRVHVTVRSQPRLAARDRGSTNGTRAFAIGGERARRLGHDTVLAIGASLVAIDAPGDPRDGRNADRSTATISSAGERTGAFAGSALGGLVLAAATGRWYLALIGLVYPAIALWPAVATRLRARREPLPLSSIPSRHRLSREAWGNAGPAFLAIVGQDEQARGFARAVVLALGRQPAEGRWREPWMRWLPPARPSDVAIEFATTGPAPSWCDAVVEVRADGGVLTRAGAVEPLPPVFVSAENADAAARRIAAEDGHGNLPRRVRWADLHLSPPTPSARSRRLAAPIGVTRTGTFTLDLDARGPHILVAGTTGSGKSAALETLVLALAAESSPADLSLALIDFKGGAGLASCVGLPHVRGILTDLDPRLARRALEALSAELADRKSALAAAGFPSFRAWEDAGDAPPRLLCVVDEYQELVALYREFVPDLARLAAQGRSLGLHLVLATQRPAGAVTPEIRANTGTTIAFRVQSDAESRDLVGTADASLLPIDAPGRAIVATGAERIDVHVALASRRRTPLVLPWNAPDAAAGEAAELAADIVERWSDAPRPGPLWLPPLPDDLGGDATTPSASPRGIWIGRGDLPAERTQPELEWDPRSGALAVLGPPRSGRTTTLRLVASQARTRGLRPVWLPLDAREAARTLALASRASDVLLLVDDLPRALSTLAEVDRGSPVDVLTTRAAAAEPFVFSSPLTGATRLVSHATTRLVLTGGDPSDASSWGVPRALLDLTPRPGHGWFSSAGLWCETQLGRTETRVDEPLVVPLPGSVEPGSLGDPDASGVPVGVGGDRATVVRIDPSRPLLVSGPAGPARDAVVTALRGAARDAGVAFDLEATDAPLALVPEIARATVVVAEPTPRSARDACRGDVDGLVDPRPPLGRVLVVVGGAAIAAQLACGAPSDGHSL